MPAMLIAMAALAGCGSDRAADRAQRPKGPAPQPTAPGIVTAEDVLAYPADTPQRALLTWFQAIQFGDARAAFELLTPAEQRQFGATRILSAAAAVGDTLGSARVRSVRVHGISAVIGVDVLGFNPQNGVWRRAPQPTSSNPVTFLLFHGRGGWRIDDGGYLLASARAVALTKHSHGAPAKR